MVLAALVFSSAPEIKALQADDGWRRTAQGWEHISAWQIDSRSPRRTSPQAYQPPQVMHPLYLVLVQVGASIVALLFVAPPIIQGANAVQCMPACSLTEGGKRPIPHKMLPSFKNLARAEA